MDIHRCRFIPYPPSSINALAFSHPSNPAEETPNSLRLAIGRENGDIEIWNPQNGQWTQESILKGGAGKTVEQLAWTQDQQQEDGKNEGGALRLFSTGGSTSVIEWDLALGAPKRKAEGNFGDLWCFAAQPPLSVEELKQGAEDLPSQILVAGCGDGTIILFSTDDDDLRYLRPLVTAPVRKSKVLSITWRDRRTVVAGYEDSIIRVIDVPNRTVIRSMTLGKPADGNKSIVWTVKCLPDGTFLSGDSSGELKVWDAKNFSLVQRLKTHQADILDIASNATGNTIFTFGVDRRTVAYKPNSAGIQGSKKQRWTEVMHRRFHDHDVKCATTFESKDISVLVSGGVDATPIITPLRDLQVNDYRRLSHLPQRPQVSASPEGRLILSWWEKQLLIYHISQRNQDGDISYKADNATISNHQLLATIQLSGEEYIQSAQISQSGNLVLAATLKGVRMFQLRRTITNGQLSIRTRPIDLPTSLRSFGARIVGFSPNGTWLYAARPDNTIILCKIIAPPSSAERPTIYEQSVKLVRKSRNERKSSLGTYISIINSLCFSSDCRIMAVGDLSGHVDVWVLEGNEDITSTENVDRTAKVSTNSNSDSESESDSDSDDDDDDYSPVIHGQKWIRNPTESTFPRLDSSVLLLTFRPSPNTESKNSADVSLGLHATRHNPHPVSHVLPTEGTKLIAITATHKIVEFDVSSGRLSDWSRRNPASQLPTDFVRIRDRIIGCFWDCSNIEKGERLWMYGSSWLFMLDVSRDLQPVNGEKIGKLGQYDVMEPLGNGLNKALAGSSNKKRKRNTGAGGKMQLKYRNAGGNTQAIQYKGTDRGESMQDIQMDDLERDSDDDEEVDESGKALVSLRRETNHHKSAYTNGKSPNHANKALTNGELLFNGDERNSDAESGEGGITSRSSPKQLRISHWSTTFYRSILGVVVLNDGQSVQNSDHDHTMNGVNEIDHTEDPNLISPRYPFEVAIIERPMHDVEQLPRFEGGQDWDA